MQEALTITAKETLCLFMLMAFGVGVRRFRMFDENCVKRLADFVLLLVTPCLIITSFQRPFAISALTGLGWAAIGSVLGYGLGIIYSRLGIRDKDVQKLRVQRFATVFSNAGFMGFPLEYALLGPEGVFYGSVYVVFFNLLCWTYGVWEIRGGFADEGWTKALVNPGTIGVTIGLPLFVFSIKLPGLIAEPLRQMGDLNTTLSMVILGYYLGGVKFTAALSRASTYMTIFLRHIAVPLTVIGIMLVLSRNWTISNTVLMAVVIPAAAPVGAAATMFAVRYGGSGEYPAALVAFSTLLSIVTMPVIIAIAKYCLG